MVRIHYFDASALLKLLVYEEGSKAVRAYFKKHSGFFTTSLCFAVTLGVLKSRYLRKDISPTDYSSACNELMSYLFAGAIGIDEIHVETSDIYSEIHILSKTHNLDINDAFQIVSLIRGFFSETHGQSIPLLITGDSDLANVLRNEGLDVWDCTTEPEPKSV